LAQPRIKYSDGFSLSSLNSLGKPGAGTGTGKLTQQQELDVLCRLYAVLLEVALDEATPGGCGSLLGRLCAAHGAYCLDAKRFEGRLVSANSMDEQRNAIFPTFSALINSPNLVNSPYFFSLASKCGKFTEVIYANAMSIFHFP